MKNKFKSVLALALGLISLSATAAQNQPDAAGNYVWCHSTISQMHRDFGDAYLTWETLPNGDVEISIDGAIFRNGGFELKNNSFAQSWKVLSGESYATVEDADVYFTKGTLSSDNLVYTLTKKANATLPVPAIIQFAGHAFSWKIDAHDEYFLSPDLQYTYGTDCSNGLPISDLTAVNGVVTIDLNTQTDYTLTSNVDYTTSSTGSLTYKSSDASVATVSESGVITPIKIGKTIIKMNQATSEDYYKTSIEIAVYVINSSYGPTVAPTAPSLPAAQVLALYSNHYDLAIEEKHNLANWGSSAFTEERPLSNGSEVVRIYNGVNGTIVWGDNNGNPSAIRGLEGKRYGSYTGLNAGLMEYIHLDVWSNEAFRLTVKCNDAALPQEAEQQAGAWVSHDIALSTLGHGEGGIDNIRWMKFEGLANGSAVAIANVYFYTTQTEADTEKPVMTSASVESVSHKAAVIAVAATDNVAIYKYVVKDENEQEVGEYVALDGKITIANLTPSTTYNWTIYAMDPAENVSDNGIDVTFTTNDDPTLSNTACHGWADDMSGEGYTYDFKTLSNGDVVITFEADRSLVGFVPTLKVNNVKVDDVENSDGKKTTATLSGLTNGANITIQWSIAWANHAGNTKIYNYTVGENCVEIDHTSAAAGAAAWENMTTDDTENMYKSNGYLVTKTPAGKHGTICLPYNATVQGAAIYAFTQRVAEGLEFDYAEETAEASVHVSAGQAYIYFATDDTQYWNLDDSEDPVAVATGNLLEGSYAEIPLENGEYFLYTEDEYFHPAGENVVLPTFRACIPVDNMPAYVPGAPVRIIVPHVATGVENVVDYKAVKAIVDGKIVIFRGDKCYNVAGAILK